MHTERAMATLRVRIAMAIEIGKTQKSESERAWGLLRARYVMCAGTLVGLSKIIKVSFFPFLLLFGLGLQTLK